jgi:hypothetical protein
VFLWSHTYHIHANMAQHLTLDASQVEGPPIPLAPDLTVSLADDTANFCQISIIAHLLSKIFFS